MEFHLSFGFIHPDESLSLADLLKDKVALVTGSGRGIGRSIAMAMAGEGAKVALTGRDTVRLEKVSEEIKLAGGQSAFWRMDVSSEMEVSDAIEKITEHWGQIDILVNNAGIIHADKPVWETTISEWDEEMATNLRGMFLCCHYVVPQMVARQNGVVINIGSSSGTIPEDMSGAYGATKWGVLGYTTSLAKSVRPHGVRVNGLNPGWVDTDMTKGQIPDGAGPEWTKPEDIARAALFLTAHAPADMTGQFINLFGANDHSGHAPGLL